MSADTASAAAPATAGAAAGAADTDTDDELMAAYVGGNSQAFEMLYTRHKGPVYRYFLRQLGNDAAQDACQETWSKLIQQADRYQPQGQFQRYLFTIAHNTGVDWHRKQMRQPVADVEPDSVADEGEALHTALSRQRLRQQLHQEIKRLPLAQRSAWLLQQEGGFSLQDIATLTQTSLEGVKSRLRYANDKLKAGMQKYVRS